jgi:hypothetical protein
MGGVDQPEHPVLDEIPDVDRVRHRRRHPARERFDERNTRDDSTILAGRDWLRTHL